MAREHRFKLSVLGRYPNRLKENEPAVTVNVMAGHDDHLVYAGTLTLSESEWQTFTSALQDSLGERLQVDEGPRGSAAEKVR